MFMTGLCRSRQARHIGTNTPPTRGISPPLIIGCARVRIGRMRIATFNVLHGRLIHQGRPLPLSTGDAPDGPLAGAVASLDADVLALQELDRCQERSGWADQARVAAAAMGAWDWRYAAALHGSSVPGKGWVLDRGRCAAGTATASRRPPCFGCCATSYQRERRQLAARRRPPSRPSRPARTRCGSSTSPSSRPLRAGPGGWPAAGTTGRSMRSAGPSRPPRTSTTR